MKRCRIVHRTHTHRQIYGVDYTKYESPHRHTAGRSILTYLHGYFSTFVQRSVSGCIADRPKIIILNYALVNVIPH